MASAVPTDVVEVNTAGVLATALLLRVDEADTRSTTALGVGHSRGGLGTFVCLLADTTVRHGVPELHAAVELDGDFDGADGERLDARVSATAERGATRRLMTTGSRDAPVIVASL